MKTSVICMYCIIWNIKWRMRCARHVACIDRREIRWSRILVEPEDKRPIDRPRSRWEHTTKMDQGNWIGRCGLDLSHQRQ